MLNISKVAHVCVNTVLFNFTAHFLLKFLPHVCCRNQLISFVPNLNTSSRWMHLCLRQREAPRKKNCRNVWKKCTSRYIWFSNSSKMCDAMWGDRCRCFFGYISVTYFMDSLFNLVKVLKNKLSFLSIFLFTFLYFKWAGTSTQDDCTDVEDYNNSGLNCEQFLTISNLTAGKW